MNKTERQREHFESISQTYYESRQSANHLVLKDLMWSHFLGDKDFLRKEGLRVLEPMCGYAEGKSILERHLRVGLDYEGFDYSDSLVARVRETQPQLNVFVMDVTKFEPTRRYDLIIVLGGLHHVPDHAPQVVRKLSQGLEEGGFFLVLEPTHNNVVFRKIREAIYRRNALFDEETERAFALDELNRMFLSSGLEIVDQVYPGLLSHVLYYNPDAFPWLNWGGPGWTRFFFRLDEPFFRNVVGRKLSFATLTLCKKVRGR